MPSDRMLEYYYAMGQDCVRAGDYDEAVTYFRKAANMGAAEGAAEICLIARRFETGDGVPKDEEKRVSSMKRRRTTAISKRPSSLGNSTSAASTADGRTRGKRGDIWSAPAKREAAKPPPASAGCTTKAPSDG